MDESATRRKKIDPALYSAGWEQVPESEILTEQRAYLIAHGHVSVRLRHLRSLVLYAVICRVPVREGTRRR